MTNIKLTFAMRTMMLDRFEDFCRRTKKPKKHIISQSSPNIGIWCDDDFYSLESILEATNKKAQEKGIHYEL